ncbi:hypothetical protein [Priestia endophytica]|uniref:hypothetical protein n=1 Tax=Priestia endophytica TaxID=135735 RepID=UPI000DCA91D6|nr:hypothetical protein [Priestia endophytica]KAB2492218.1 hypothetical protein F8155_17140 [Priestia endophytica]RAS78183.1 hypothetical protein A4R27_17580 [Priestia endophytica]RAS87453.1 hypothetical protein A4U60_05140 [Priestia endophytica]
MCTKQIVISAMLFLILFASAFMLNSATRKEYLDDETIEKLVKHYGESIRNHPLRSFDSREYVRVNKPMEEFEFGVE